ncbi:MAG: hypothetical protein ACRCY9_01270, partial [Phycicoccus sp.]
MSDRRIPTDRDPLADRLRALGDHGRDTAVLPSAEQVHVGGDRRRRNRRLSAAGAALAVAAVAGSLAVGSALGRDTALDTAPATTSPRPSATAPATSLPSATASATARPTPPSSGSPSAVAPPGPAATGVRVTTPYRGTRADVGDIGTVVVPDGWSAVPYQVEASSGPAQDAVCLTDPDTRRPSWLDCDLLIQYGDRPVGAQGMRWASHQPSGWSVSARMPNCPFESEVDSEVRPENGGTPHGSFGAVGSRLAELSSYDVSCPGTSWAFEPRTWWVQARGVLVTDVLGHDRAVEILASVTFADEPAAAPLRHVQADLLDRSTMTAPGPLLLQPIRRYVDDPRGFHWAETEGRLFPLRGGWASENAGPDVDLTLTSETSCFAYVDGTLGTYGPQRSCRDFREGGDAVVDAVATSGGDV